MATDPTPKYNKNLHPIEEWYRWYTDNEAELKMMSNDTNSDIYAALIQTAEMYGKLLVGDIRFYETVEKLSELRYAQCYEYKNIFGKKINWSPSLTGDEKMILDSQILKFYEDNKGIRSLRPRPQSALRIHGSISTIDLTM